MHLKIFVKCKRDLNVLREQTRQSNFVRNNLILRYKIFNHIQPGHVLALETFLRHFLWKKLCRKFTVGRCSFFSLEPRRYQNPSFFLFLLCVSVLFSHGFHFAGVFARFVKRTECDAQFDARRRAIRESVSVAPGDFRQPRRFEQNAKESQSSSFEIPDNDNHRYLPLVSSRLEREKIVKKHGANGKTKDEKEIRRHIQL